MGYGFLKKTLGFSRVWRKLQNVGSEEDVGLWWGVGAIKRFQRWGEGLGAWARGECSKEQRGVQGEGSGLQMRMERQGLVKNMESLGFTRGLRGSGEGNGVQGRIPSLREGTRVLGRG